MKPQKPSKADVNKIEEIFFPHDLEKREEARQDGSRFAYYTTAEVAVSILQREQMWMRNIRMMNDFSEFSHGFECLDGAIKSEVGAYFKENINKCFPGLFEEVVQRFNAWLPKMDLDTYITCLSVHHPHENKLGRLSMWRAYGGTSGVAIVINGAPMLESNADIDLGVYSSPVAYLDKNEFIQKFHTVASNIEAEHNYIKRLGREPVLNAIFAMFRFSALCTKHPGFSEEQEWRIIACPDMYPSPLTDTSVEIVRGIPQTVLKLNLRDLPEYGLSGIAIPQLLDRIIIGPCDFPYVMYTAFRQLLSKYGDQAKEKIMVSDIPLRHL